LKILITNDDGIDAPGLAVMREIAAAISSRPTATRVGQGTASPSAVSCA
jgi:broad specificity polyphosphatase/5'/3'-nucleotidase SurE